MARIDRVFVFLAILCTAGCTHLPWRRTPPDYEGPPPAQVNASDRPTESGTDTATSAMTETDRQALLKVLDELQSISGLSPHERAQLMADLRQTKPSLWPAMVQQFRAALAFRQQLQERDAAEQASATVTGTQLAGLDRATTEPVAGTVPQAPIGSSPARSGRPDGAEAGEPAVKPQRPGVVPAATTALPMPGTIAPTVPPANSAVPLAASASSPPRPTTAAPAPRAGEPAAAVGGRLTEKDWRANLSRVIDDLEQETRAAPRTGTDVNRQAVLRILYLIADRREDALQPIPGIPPTLQDFWSKQLYGLATYLDSSQQPDSARRATMAKQYLCQAASRLGELGLLTVQNLALCTEVSSFGVFRTFEQSQFTPGQEVLLYAEVNNFHSEETEKGFRTALRSSYQILDSAGQRVAQREFAVTEDYCKNLRRDFFMRYFIRLPVEIEPGTYMLELTIEDTLANKIGQSSLPLEIKTTAAKRQQAAATIGGPLGR